MKNNILFKNIWLIFASLVATISVFSVLLEYYAYKIKNHIAGGYTPLLFGLFIFAAIMFIFTDKMIAKKESRRIWLSLFIVAIESFIFFCAFMIFSVNVFGT